MLPYSRSFPVRAFYPGWLIPAIFFIFRWCPAAIAAPPMHPGWPSYDGVNTESPVAADIDRDDKLEILWGRLNAMNVLHEDGSFVTGWPQLFSYNPSGPPSVAQLDGAAIIGMCSGDFNVKKGQISLWRANGKPLPGWPKAIITGNMYVPHQTPLVLADVDGDGKPEVIYISSTASDGTGTAIIHVDRIDGTSLPGWPVTLPLAGEDIYDGSPAVADVDGDGRLDVAVVTFHGKIFLYHDNGVLFAGWPVTQGSGNLISNSVSFADVNGDAQLDLVVTTYDGRVGVYDLAGHPLSGWPRTVLGKPSPPAFSDLENDGRIQVTNNDGKLEIVFGTLSGALYVLRSDGTNFPGWPKSFPSRVDSVALVDLNSDGKIDLLATDGARNMYAFDYNGNGLTALGFPFQIPGNFGFYSGPVVADVDRDGLIEFLALGDTSVYMWDLPTTFNPFTARSRTMMGDNQHQSRYSPEPNIYTQDKPVYAYTANPVQFTVYGSGFLKGMHVFIGDREQSVSNVTGTSLTVTANNVPVPLGDFALYPLRVSNVNSGSSEPLLDAVWVWRSSTTPPPTPTPTVSPTSTPRPAVIVYSQSPSRNGGANSDGIVTSVADDFQLSADTTVTRIRWWGGYFNPPPVPDAFSVRLFADQGGQPGALISTLDLAAINKTRTGFSIGSVPEFEYVAGIRNPFVARAGVRYWLSIVTPPNSVWGWEASRDHNLAGGSRSFTNPVTGPWQPYDIDSAFQLESNLGGLANISTRARVEIGDNALIAGLIVTGSDRTKVLIRAIGPSLSAFGVIDSLQDPMLELHDASGAAIALNNNWKVTEPADVFPPDPVAAIQATGAAPSDDRESAMIATLDPNTNYTVIVRGAARTSGIAVVEAYDLNYGSVARLANISTRSFVQTGQQVMIGGFIIRQPSGRVIVRALGPSLQAFGITNALPNPFLELHDSNGALLGSNDDWRADQESEIIATKLPPSQDVESALVANLPAGAYTGIVRDAAGAAGIGLIEVYDLDP